MDKPHGIKRPKPIKDEDEDDILQMQQQFMQDKSSKCSTKVVKSGNNNNDARKRVDFEEDDKPEKLSDNHSIPMTMDIRVVERDVSMITEVKSPRVVKNLPFPSTKKINLDDKTNSSSSRKQSLFAKQFGSEKVSPRSKLGNNGGSIINASSLRAEERHEVYQIHEDNLKKLESMSIEEIDAARQELLSTLDQSRVEYFKKRRQKLQTNQTQDDVKTNQACDHSSAKNIPEEILEGVPLVKESLKQGWFKITQVEEDKLKWMTPLDENSDKTKDTTRGKEARFDFEGCIVLDSSKDEDTRLGLHHHGEEPGRAGYSLGELLTLIESSFPQQKSIGLITIGKIMTRSYRGVYDGTFETCIAEQLLKKTDILLKVRATLDDTNDSVRSAALSCLRGLLCNTDLDEMQLDRIFVWNLIYLGKNALDLQQLNPHTVNSEQLTEMKDIEVVQRDPILGLLRTDLLERLRYLLDTSIKHQDDPVIVKNLISILIRIARHSKESSESIFRTPYLIETIIDNFIQPRVSFDLFKFYGTPYFPALKLLRVLCCQSSDITNTVMSKYGSYLIPSLQVYLTLDPSNLSTSSSSKVAPSNLLQVSIESLRLYCILLKSESPSVYDEALESLTPMFSVLMKSIQYAFSLNPLDSDFCDPLDKSKDSSSSQFDWQFCSVLLSNLVILHEIEKKKMTSPLSTTTRTSKAFTSLIESLILSWTTKLMNHSLLPSSMDISTCIASGIHFLLAVDQSIMTTGDSMEKTKHQPFFIVSLLMEKILIPMSKEGSNAHIFWTKLINKVIARSSLIKKGMKDRDENRDSNGQTFDQNLISDDGRNNKRKRRSCSILPDFGSLECELREEDPPKINQILSNDSCLPLLHAFMEVVLKYQDHQDKLKIMKQKEEELKSPSSSNSSTVDARAKNTRTMSDKVQKEEDMIVDDDYDHGESKNKQLLRDVQDGKSQNEENLLILYLSRVHQSLNLRQTYLKIFDYHEMLVIVKSCLILRTTLLHEPTRLISPFPSVFPSMIESHKKKSCLNLLMNLSLTLVTFIHDEDLIQRVLNRIIFNEDYISCLVSFLDSPQEDKSSSAKEYSDDENRQKEIQGLRQQVHHIRIEELRMNTTMKYGSPIVLRKKETLQEWIKSGKLQQILNVYSQVSYLSSIYWLFDPIVNQIALQVHVNHDEKEADTSRAIPSHRKNRSEDPHQKHEMQKDIMLDDLNCCLSFISLIQILLPNYLPMNIGATEFFVLITCTFLTGNNNFLDSRIAEKLREWLHFFLGMDRRLLLLNPNQEIPIPVSMKLKQTCHEKTGNEFVGRTNVFTFFEFLVKEYESSSYSDPIFTSFLMMFMRSDLYGQQRSELRRSDNRMKEMFFSEENASCLQGMHTRLSDFDEELMQQLMFPLESDEVIIEGYLKALLSGNVKKDRNQLLYQVCCHHVRSFLNCHTNSRGDVDDDNPCKQTTAGLNQQAARIEDHDQDKGTSSLGIQKLRRSIEVCRNETLKKDLL